MSEPKGKKMHEDFFIAEEEQVEAIKGCLCPVACPYKEEGPVVERKHIKKSAPVPNFHGFLHAYWCKKYRSVLGSHTLRPFSVILGDGNPQLVVMKSPFCPDTH